MLLVVVILIGIVSDRLYTKKTIRAIMSSTTKKIEMDIGDTSDITKHIEISDSILLETIDRCFLKNIEFTPDRPSIHASLVNIYIYKSDKKITIRALKTRYSGWVITFGDRYFKNDSLINLLINH